MNINRKAFLDTIAHSEDTAGRGNDGYNVIVGNSLFTDYARHPNVLVFIKQIHDYSTAAGRYRILYKNWVFYCKELNLHDFSPAVQDAIALRLIRECKALDDIDLGNFNSAVKKCSRRWASFPGAGDGKRENTLDSLRIAYIKSGGVVA